MTTNPDDRTVFPSAPISWRLQVIGWSAILVILALLIWLPRAVRMPTTNSALFFVFIAGILFIAWLMNPRKLILTRDRLIIERFLLPISLPRDSMSEARIQPEAMTPSLRVCGNGGFFAWVGWFYKKEFGLYRAYVTDSKKTVVFRAGKRICVVSPADPEAFIECLQRSTY
ncbi:MAG: hypothetical protein B9S32_00425 [Verrucomicrobia bacterium Tous-C9LFEB]|nr:MAG: hypothetical protein B9S32_00425 [Verrucomicrobia bacterium Tous-C9LFEB]